MPAEYQKKFPTLKAIMKFTHKKLYSTLATVPSSQYKGWSKAQIKEKLSSNEARRYLTSLAVRNEVKKANLSCVNETS